MAHRGTTSRTLTLQEVQQQCETLVLRLKSPESTTTKSEAKTIVSNARTAVDVRFKELVNKHVMDKDKNINDRLLQALQASDNQRQFLESFIVGLYGKAVEQEEAHTLKSLTDEDKTKLHKLVDKDKDNDHGGDAHKHQGRKQTD